MIHLKYLKFNESHHAIATNTETHRTNALNQRTKHLIDNGLN